MQERVRRWLDDLPLSDPLERQQASLLQVMLLIILGSGAIGPLISVISSTTGEASIEIGLVAYTVLVICTLGGLLLLRRGHWKICGPARKPFVS